MKKSKAQKVVGVGEAVKTNSSKRLLSVWQRGDILETKHYPDTARKGEMDPRVNHLAG